MAQPLVVLKKSKVSFLAVRFLWSWRVGMNASMNWAKKIMVEMKQKQGEQEVSKWQEQPEKPSPIHSFKKIALTAFCFSARKAKQDTVRVEHTSKDNVGCDVDKQPLILRSASKLYVLFS